MTLPEIETWWMLAHGETERLLSPDPGVRTGVTEYSIHLVAFLRALETAGVGEGRREEFFHLKTAGRPSLFAAVAAREECPEHLMPILARSGNVSAAVLVAENPNCPQYLADELSQHEKKEVRAAAAERAWLSTGAFERLLRDRSTRHVLTMLARNPHAPDHVLRELVRRKLWDAIWFVAVNPSAEPGTLKMILRIFPEDVDDPADYSKYVIRASNHPNMREEALEELVRICCLPDTGRWLSFTRSQVASRILGGDGFPERFYRRLAETGNPDVHYALLRDPYLPTVILETLARGKNHGVASSAANLLRARRRSTFPQ